MKKIIKQTSIFNKTILPKKHICKRYLSFAEDILNKYGLLRLEGKSASLILRLNPQYRSDAAKPAAAKNSWKIEHTRKEIKENNITILKKYYVDIHKNPLNIAVIKDISNMTGKNVYNTAERNIFNMTGLSNSIDLFCVKISTMNPINLKQKSSTVNSVHLNNKSYRKNVLSSLRCKLNHEKQLFMQRIKILNKGIKENQFIKFNSSINNTLLEVKLKQGNKELNKGSDPEYWDVPLIHDIENITNDAVRQVLPALSRTRTDSKTEKIIENRSFAENTQRIATALQYIKFVKKTNIQQKNRKNFKEGTTAQGDLLNPLIVKSMASVIKFQKKFNNSIYSFKRKWKSESSSENKYINNTSIINRILSKNKPESKAEQLPLVQRNEKTVLIYDVQSSTAHNINNKFNTTRLNELNINDAAFEEQKHLVLRENINKRSKHDDSVGELADSNEIKELSSRVADISKQIKDVKNISGQEVKQIADHVLKILEKKTAIQKDRRGLL